MALIYGIRSSFSVFFPPILDEFGWSRGSTAFMLSLNLLIYGFMAPVAGALGDRWRPRTVMIVGIIILSIVTSGCAFARELWHFYLFFGILMPTATAFVGWPMIAPMLTHWFTQRRGLVLGLGQVGGGISFASAVFFAFVISQLGWRNAYFVQTGILAITILPLYFFLLRFRPEDKGLKPYGSEEIEIPSVSKNDSLTTEQQLPHDWTLRGATKSHRMWLLLLSFLLFRGLVGYMVLAHQVQFAVDVGYSSTFAASIFAMYGIFMVAGQFSAFLSDLIGREMTVTIATILSIGALVALISVGDTSQPWLLYIYAICFGYGSGLFIPTFFAGAADIFHGRHYGSISGILLTGVGTGGFIGPWLGGYIHDISGSYYDAFVIGIICCCIACVAFWIAAPRNAKKLRRPT